MARVAAGVVVGVGGVGVAGAVVVLKVVVAGPVVEVRRAAVVGLLVVGVGGVCRWAGRRRRGWRMAWVTRRWLMTTA